MPLLSPVNIYSLKPNPSNPEGPWIQDELLGKVIGVLSENEIAAHEKLRNSNLPDSERQTAAAKLAKEIYSRYRFSPDKYFTLTLPDYRIIVDHTRVRKA